MRAARSVHARTLDEHRARHRQALSVAAGRHSDELTSAHERHAQALEAAHREHSKRLNRERAEMGARHDRRLERHSKRLKKGFDLRVEETVASRKEMWEKESVLALGALTEEVARMFPAARSPRRSM
jgi:hypothetical protein